MKWAYATTASIVRCLQKDQFYRNQIESDLKLVLLDHLNVGWYLKLEDWLPLIVDLFYYTTLTGCGRRTLGESYSSILPVDTKDRKLLLSMRVRRMVWVLVGVVIPHALKRCVKGDGDGYLKIIIDFVNEFKSILFYISGKYPSFTNRFLSIRYVFYPRRPPMLDEDSLIYKGLAAVLAIVSISKLKDSLTAAKQRQQQINETPKQMTCSEHKCPVCLDPLVSPFTSTNCGHVYCWQCIVKWMQGDESCPVCRVACEPPDLLPLANF